MTRSALRVSVPPIRKAFIYAAGLGTRLRPYTLQTPKPMLEVFGRPMVEYVLCYLRTAGVTHVTVNAAWRSEAFAPLPERAARLGLDLDLSLQPEPYEHGGDLATATRFLAALEADEVFLALNGDTLFWLDPARLHELAGALSAAAPLLILGHETEANPLHVQGGRLVGIGPHRYLEAEPPAHGDDPFRKSDDFGIRLVHASICRALPPPRTRMSLHGPGGLVERLIEAGKDVLVQPVADAARVEIGTVADYEARATNRVLRALTARLCG